MTEDAGSMNDCDELILCRYVFDSEADFYFNSHFALY